MENPDQPPEARLIDAAQKAAVPPQSMRRAAEAAGISDGRWRQIVKGYQSTGTGRIPVVAPDDTLARMAIAVGVTPDELAETGRTAAADVQRALLDAGDRPDVELSEVSTERLLAEIRRRIEGAEPQPKLTRLQVRQQRDMEQHASGRSRRRISPQALAGQVDEVVGEAERRQSDYKKAAGTRDPRIPPGDPGAYDPGLPADPDGPEEGA